MDAVAGLARRAPLADGIQHLRCWRARLLTWLARPLSRGPASVALGGLVGLSALLHLLVIRASTGAAFDILSYHLQAQALLAHRNVYVATQRYPYPPVWIWLVGLAQLAASALALPFDQVVKLPASLADLAIIVVMARYVAVRRGWCRLALVLPALYALNPLVLLVSAGHGQFDTLVLLWILVALHLHGPVHLAHKLSPVASGLALGIAIALKGFPVLLLPYLVHTTIKGQRLRVLLAALAPLLVSMIVYSALFGFVPEMLTHVLSYKGAAAFGWVALLLQILPLAHAPDAVWFVVVMLLLASEVFMLVFAAVVPARVLPGAPIRATTLVFAVFYASTATMGAQYVVWILPFVCLCAPLAALCFTLVALLAVAPFYSADIGAMGALPHLPAFALLAQVPQSARMPTLVAFILVCAALSMRLLRSARHKSPRLKEATLPQ